ncbi:MAG: translation initiation factor IF-2 [Bacillota bacterium]|nr:translation initiation factor IF-2 [Bacillota bacterium]
MRIYELSKILNVSSKEIIKVARDEFEIQGLKSHMSSVSELQAAKIQKYYIKGKESEEKKEEVKKEKTKRKNKPTQQRTEPKPKRPKRDLSKKTKGKKGDYKGKEDEEEVTEFEIGETISVKEISELFKVNSNEIIKKLMSYGVMATINEEIDFDTAVILAEEFDFTITKKEEENQFQKMLEELDFEDDKEDLKLRPPIITVMGHVDHGKTSLLDAIRDTHTADQEAGGITQHIGASVIEKDGRKMTFIDTPGHEAFTEMRSRGAQVTDIAILVVAADDGIMPQTEEAINHAKAAGVPIIVAINKIDKSNANPDRVKQELTEHALVPEEWGGDTICVEVSALKKIGIKELLEMILLVADIQEIKANPDRNAVGVIIDAKLDKGRGPVSTVLIKKGTLHKGDFVLVGVAYGKIRTMVGHKGERIEQAGPSYPVEITGLSDVPEAGEILYVVEDEKLAKDLASIKQDKVKEDANKRKGKVSLEDLFDQIKDGEVKDLNIVIKADVRGSIEAVKQSLEKLSIEEVKVNVIHSGVGGINENDVMLASASNAIIIGFNVRPTNQAIELSKAEEVEIKTYRIIYNAIEDIEAAVTGMLEPEFEEVMLGRAVVRDIFKVPNAGTVAGIYVQQGSIKRNAQIRLLRDSVVVHEGEISSLKRFKDDVKEVNTGYEGGLGIHNYNDVKKGDVIEAFVIQEVKKK